MVRIEGPKKTLVIGQKDYERFLAICEAAGSKEIQWFCSIEEEEDKIYVKDVYIPEQTATGVEVTTSAEQIFNMLEELKDPVPMWCHSHVNMATNPSPKDIETSKELLELGFPFLIMFIINKRGEMHAECFTVRDEFFLSYDVPIRRIGAYDFEEWAKLQVKEKMKEKYTYFHHKAPSNQTSEKSKTNYRNYLEEEELW